MTAMTTQLAPSVLQHPSAVITLDGRTMSYTLRQSSRARHLGLRLDPASGLIVTVPRQLGALDAERYLQRHKTWVLRWVARFERRFKDLPKRWPYGTSLLYRGIPYQVQVIVAHASSVEATLNQQLIVSAKTPSVEAARRVLTRWLKSEAERVIAERTQTWSAMMNLTPKRVYVRPLRRKWGSCWPGGSLSFSLHLIMAPPEVLDYVVVHELSHLRERNHSKHFWALVSAYDPHCLTHRKWLRTHGLLLAV